MASPATTQYVGCGVEEDILIQLESPDKQLGLCFTQLVVTGVLDGAAAERYRSKCPFLIRKLEGKPITTTQQLTETVKAVKGKGGTEYRFTIERCQVMYTVKVGSVSDSLGLSYQNTTDGVKVIKSKAACAAAGLPEGAIMMSINGQPIHSYDQVATIFADLKRRNILIYNIGTMPVMSPSAAPTAPAAVPPSPLQQQPAPAQPMPQAERPPESPIRHPSVHSIAETETAIPPMPFFEPSHDNAAKYSLEKGLQDYKAGKYSGLSFPADRNFWHNFQQQVALGGQKAAAPPHYIMKASHEPDNKLTVNQGFMQAFVEGWEEQNPHIVTVYSSDGKERTFHASHEFWRNLDNKIGKNPPGGDRTMIITSSLRPGEKVHASKEEWNGVCMEWEREKNLTQEERDAHAARRQNEIPQERETAPPPSVPTPLIISSPTPTHDPTSPPPKSVSVSTQYVDPREITHLRDFIPPANQNRPPPFSSPPPGPGQGGTCVECHQPKPAVCPTCHQESPPSRGQKMPPRHTSPAVDRYLKNRLPQTRDKSPSYGGYTGGDYAVAQGDNRFWASFVKEWEGVATDMQRAAGNAYVLDGVVDTRDL